MWDVDGTGIRKIDDDNLARAFMTKVNEMNLESGRDAFLLAVGFAALPSDFTGKLAGATALVTTLYLLRGKIPKGV